MKLQRARQPVCTAVFTFRAVLSNEALITHTHSILAAPLVLAVSWAGQYRAVRSGETFVTHTVTVNTIASV